MAHCSNKARQRFGLAFSGLLLAAGCSSALPNPVQINPTPTAPTSRVDLALPLHKSGFFEFNRWPKACDLLTDEDIRAVLPQAEGFHRRSEDQKMTIHPDLLSEVFSPPMSVVVTNANCAVGFSLPGARYKRELPDSSGFILRLSVIAAGNEEVVKLNAPGTERDTRINLGGATCVDDSFNSYRCTKDRIVFSISGPSSGTIQGKINGKHAVRYQIGAEVTTFVFPDGDAPLEQVTAAAQKRAKFEAEHISVELVKIVASKI